MWKKSNDTDASDTQFRRLRQFVHERLIDSIETSDSDVLKNSESIRKHIEKLIDRITAETGKKISNENRQSLIEDVFQEVSGMGPLAPLMMDSSVSDILVNGPDEVWVDRAGRLTQTDVRFDDEFHLRRFLDRLISAQGKHLDANSPAVDAKLPDGSRLHAMIPPICAKGPIVSIRRFIDAQSSPQAMIDSAMLTQPMLDFLQLAVSGGLNVVVAGGAAAGKTTLLNGISSFIPDSERVVTIEESAELQLRHPHVVTLESRQGNSEGRGLVDLRMLLRNALRMRADRIIVGEVRGNEVFEMLQAMTVGHDGSLSTVHANSPADALKRLESLALLADVGLPREAIRDIIGSAVHIIVQAARFRDGSRCVTRICEVVCEDGVLSAHDIFRYQPKSAHPSAIQPQSDGLSQPDGTLVPMLNQSGEQLICNRSPHCLSILRNRGYDLPAELAEIMQFSSQGNDND